MSREFLLRGSDDSVVQAYYDYMVDMAVIFGADKERAKQEFREVIEFETSLANVSEIIPDVISCSYLQTNLMFLQLKGVYPNLC